MTRVSCFFFWILLTLAVSMELYHTSYRVDALAHDLHALNASIETERVNIHVLKAEWVYLSNPSRVEKAARRYLDLEPTRTEQIARLDRLSSILAARTALKAVTSFGNKHAAYAPRSAATESERVNAWRIAGDSLHVPSNYGSAP